LALIKGTFTPGALMLISILQTRRKTSRMWLNCFKLNRKCSR